MFLDTLATTISKKFISLRANLLQIREDIQTLLEKPQRQESPERNSDFLTLFNFPLMTTDGLDEVNNYLINEENFKNAVSSFYPYN